VAQSPFLQVPPLGTNAQGGTPFALMQTSDDANRNLYAPAYVKPVYDLRTLSTASFNRNVNHGLDISNQVRAQTMTSSANYWLVYVQGAFQGPEFQATSTGVSVDGDPNDEVLTTPTAMRSVVNGETSAVVGLGTLSRIGGSTIYIETIRDFNANHQMDCLTGTVVHETGHQFGLKDVPPGQGGGIMEPCSATRQRRFTDDHLNAIRQRPHPQGG
jgi:hypothetical protein